MEYTHYFTIKKTPDAATINQIHKAVMPVLDNYENIIKYECDSVEGKPVNASGIIRFNGIEDDGHETFLVDLNRREFNFCKTARKPYDVPVCTVLAILRVYLGEDLELSSDGDFNQEWSPILHSIYVADALLDKFKSELK